MASGRNLILLRVSALFADAVFLVLAFILAYWMRYELELGREVPEASYIRLQDYWLIMFGLVAILLIAYFASGLYADLSVTSVLDQGGIILGSTSMGVVVALAGIFFSHGQAYSRLLFVFFWGIAIGLLLVQRFIKKMVLINLRKKGIGTQRVLVVGAGPLGRMVMHIVSTEQSLPYQLVGFVEDDCEDFIGRFKCLGRLSEMRSLTLTYQIDEVFIALPNTSHRTVLQIMRQCERMGVSFKIVPDLYEMSLSRVSINDVRGIPLIGVKEVSISGGNLVVKRVVDIIVAAAVLAVLSPLWLFIAILIRLDSSGPVLFAQPRLGKGGVIFNCLKFRSMKVNAEAEKEVLQEQNEASGPIFKMKDDPRVTRVGKLMRRLSIDEIPQFINVLKGEMSLVGPRPPIPAEVEQYEDWHKERLEIAPGITGLWQVSGRSDLPFDEMVMLDIYYIENWTLGLDFNILFRTIPAVLTGRGAY
ncbi:MAG: sugar transferase [Dehalococcoidia bacterium]|nr:sugar transferase [Dehalococcoidia bacterium]